MSHLKVEDYAPFEEAELKSGVSWSPAEGFTALQALIGRLYATLVLQSNARVVFEAAFKRAEAERDEARRVARKVARLAGSDVQMDETELELVRTALAYPEVKP